MKHIIGKLQEVKIGRKVVVKLNSRRYHATVIDLLDWVPSKRKQKVVKSKEQKTEVLYKGMFMRCLFSTAIHDNLFINSQKNNVTLYHPGF